MAASRQSAAASAEAPSGRRYVPRRPWLVLLALLPILVAVPLIGPSVNPNLWGDEPGYLRLAHNLSEGRYLTGRDDQIVDGPAYPNLWFGPGLPVVLAPLVALDVPLTAIRLLGPLLLLAAAALLFGLLRLYVSEGVALAAAVAFALYVPFYTALVHLHSELLALPLVVAMMLGTSLYLRSGRPVHLAVAGVALGWLALTRVAYGWVVVVLLLAALVWWAASRAPAARRFAAVCGVALAVTIPWLAYTYSVTERPFYWGASGGLSLYWASSPYDGELGDWHQAREVFADPRLARHRPFFESLAGRPLVEQDDALLREGLQNVRDRPAKYAENVLANVSRMWFHFPYSFRAERLQPLLFVVPNAIMLSLLLASLALVATRRARLPVEAVPFGLFAVAGFGLHALLAAYPRMLFPLVPVFVWLIAVVLGRTVRLSRSEVA